MLGRVQKVSVAGERSDNLSPRNRPTLHEDEQRNVTDQMLMVAAEVDIQEELIRQRETGINTIQRDVNRIHDLFQDVALHVSDQGQVLDNIEANVASAADRTRNANDQLISANRRRGTTRQNLLCLLLISILILILILMIKSLFRLPTTARWSQGVSEHMNPSISRIFEV
jgi:t-SNARE complex subunit (syntaxin)